MIYTSTCFILNRTFEVHVTTCRWGTDWGGKVTHMAELIGKAWGGKFEFGEGNPRTSHPLHCTAFLELPNFVTILEQGWKDETSLPLNFTPSHFLNYIVATTTIFALCEYSLQYTSIVREIGPICLQYQFFFGVEMGQGQRGNVVSCSTKAPPSNYTFTLDLGRTLVISGNLSLPHMYICT